MRDWKKETRRKRRARREKRKADPDRRMAMILIRSRVHFDQAKLAKAIQMSSSQVSQFDQGNVTVPDEPLERTADATDLPRFFLAPVLHVLRSFRLAVEGWSRIGRAPAEIAVVDGLALSAGMAEAVLAVRGPRPGARRALPEEEREEAAALWAKMERRTPKQRLALVEEAEEYRGWALVERVAAASLEAAPECAAKALERALLARRIAELSRPGEERQRSRNLGYAEFHVANALRVANDLPGADLALATAGQLWLTGAPGATGLLNEVFPLWIEASIHRDQGRFPQALQRIDRALGVDRGDLRGKLLLSKAQIFEALGDTEKSSAVLEEAIPCIDAEREPRTLLGAWFQLLVNLCLDDHAAEAEPGLPSVRRLAEQLGKELDLVRVVWLEGKVWAGLKRTAEAEAAFEQARQEFAARELDFDYALVSLDKALLLLEQGRAGEVRALAEEMTRIFRRQRVARESLAALRLYCDAARREAATAELTRQLIRFLHRSQHDPALQFQAGEGTKDP